MFEMELYHLHPIAVHFPIAFLTLGFAIGCAAIRDRPAWLAAASSWLLWFGTVSAWVALGFGLLAQKTAPHVPPAWETLADHKDLAFWTVGMFTFLSAWRLWMKGRCEKIFLIVWLVSLGVLIATAYEGGELVFMFGMGGPSG